MVDSAMPMSDPREHVIEWPSPSGEDDLQALVATAGFRLVVVAHEGWPLGLLVDGAGYGWAVGCLDADREMLRLRRVDLEDLAFELRRLLGLNVTLSSLDTQPMPGLDLPSVAAITFTCLRWPVVVVVPAAVAALATMPTRANALADEGAIFRTLEIASAILQCEPPEQPEAENRLRRNLNRPH